MTQLRIAYSRLHEKPGDWKDTSKLSSGWPKPSPARSNALLVKVELLTRTRPGLAPFVEKLVDYLLE